MDRVLTAGLTSRQSIRLGSPVPPDGSPFCLVLAELLFRSSSTRISLELTTEGGGDRGKDGVGALMGMVGVAFEGAGGGACAGLVLAESGRRVAVGGDVGSSGRSRRRGIGGLRSFCCWQPFLISFRLGELSRLGGQIRPVRRPNVTKTATGALGGGATGASFRKNNKNVCQPSEATLG